MKFVIAFLSLLFGFSASKLSSASYFYNSNRPLVLCHRGTFGLFPEHSEGGYSSCQLTGADFVELDL